VTVEHRQLGSNAARQWHCW